MAMATVLVAKETVKGILDNVVCCVAGGSSVEMAPIDFEHEDMVEYTKNFSKEISKGGCAIVYEGHIPKRNPYNLPKQEVAIKKLLTMQKIQQFETEVRWLEAFRHEGIVRYIGRCRTGEEYFIVLELMKKTDLARNIHALNWNDTLKILRHIAATISYMHSFTLDHPGLLVIGDLKCQNILLDKGNRPKLCDFGTIETEGSTLYGYTPWNVDPDAYNRNTITQRDDLYCFGVIILQLTMKEAALTKDGVRIKDLAETKLGTDHHLVHPDLLQSGCSISDAVAISKLAMKLLQTKKPKNSPPVCQNIFSELVAEGKNEECEIVEEEDESGNVSVSSEEPDRGNIQDAIESLESLQLEQRKSNRERATEQLQKLLKRFKKSASKSKLPHEI